MAFPTTGILDDFNGGDAQPPSGSWSDDPGDNGDNQLSQESNTVVSASGTSSGYWNPLTFTEAEVFISIPTKGGNGDELGLYTRLDAPNTTGVDGYKAEWTVRGAVDKCEIFRIDNGSLTQLGLDRTVEMADGDDFGFWSDGTTHRFYIDDGGGWAETFNEVDATYTAAGEIGLRIEATVYVCDDFGGGEVVAVGVIQDPITSGIIPFRR